MARRPRSKAVCDARDPLRAVPIAVRAAETMTASPITAPFASVAVQSTRAT